jgi:hypothetical protein
MIEAFTLVIGIGVVLGTDTADWFKKRVEVYENDKSPEKNIEIAVGTYLENGLLNRGFCS